MLNNTAIETISVSAVRNSIVKSPFLDQFISDNDKEPSWDGFVNIYRDSSKRKSELKGRLPIQVKGKQCDDFSKKEISFPMHVADLRNYLHGGGAVLFVVYISSDGNATKIFYSELPPIKLRRLLSSSNEHTKTVILKEFPDDDDTKLNILSNCLLNCRMQSSFTDAKLYSLEELKKIGLLKNLEIPLSGKGIDDLKTALFRNEVYVYAQVKGSTIPQPLDILPDSLEIKEVVEKSVKIDNEVFYSEYSKTTKATTTKLQLGGSLTIECNHGTKSCSISYKNSSQMRVLAKDLDFFLKWIETGYFEANGAKILFDLKSANFSNFNIQEEKDKLLFAKRSVQVLNLLNCKEDLDLPSLTDEDIQNLKRLAISLIDKKPVHGLKPDLPPVLNMVVGGLKFTLIVSKDKTGSGNYSIFDFFKKELNLTYESDKGEAMPISQYALYSADDLLKISNLRPELFLPSFQKNKCKGVYTRANFFLLELLTAYDRSGGNQKNLLKAAKEFAEWIKSAPEDELEWSMKIINYYQVIKRERALNTPETYELWRIAQNNATSNICKVGAYLLLEQQIPASQCFEKLTDAEKEDFRTFPIYNFWVD